MQRRSSARLGSRHLPDGDQVSGAIAEGDDSAADDLPELHATLSGLKVSKCKTKSKRGGDTAVVFAGWVLFSVLDFVGRSGTTRAEGPHGALNTCRGGKRIRVDHSRARGLFYRLEP